MRSAAQIKRQARWKAKQLLAGSSRFYGDDGTIHTSTDLDVEVCGGEVIAVWFRCQRLPFRQRDIDPSRANQMRHTFDQPLALTGVEVLDGPKYNKRRTNA